MAHNLAGGVVVINNQKVLLVKDDSGWSLPREFRGIEKITFDLYE